MRGNCLCGGIRFRIAGQLYGALYCHCSMCRKASGSAFSARAAVKAADLELLQGAELVTFYQSSPGTHRGFCRVCESPIVSKFDAHPKYYGLPLGRARRRSEDSTGAARSRREQGALVHHHRRSAAAAGRA